MQGSICPPTQAHEPEPVREPKLRAAFSPTLFVKTAENMVMVVEWEKVVTRKGSHNFGEKLAGVWRFLLVRQRNWARFGRWEAQSYLII
jgi:hypothetical protein